jgi:hypothetical protein
VGHYSANLFGENEVKLKIVGNEPIESLENPWGFPKILLAQQVCFSITMDKKSEAAIHLR